ncbi:MAG: hypothetical protein GX121_10100 [Ignavibacteria bacterium]|nr:hypothetical protein [Ignavibacteria bacterium]
MLTFYLCCLIFGGILLGVSLFGGHDGDAAEHSAELDMHDAPELEAGSDIHITQTGAIGHQITQSHFGHKDAVKFVSFRNLIYFTAFFGLTGSIFTFLSVSAVFTFLASSAVGALSWFSGYKLFKYLKESETGKGIETLDLKGKICKVTLPVKQKQKGKIIVYLEEQIIEMQAKISDSAQKNEFLLNEEALIVDVKDNIAFIDLTNF